MSIKQRILEKQAEIGRLMLAREEAKSTVAAAERRVNQLQQDIADLTRHSETDQTEPSDI